MRNGLLVHKALVPVLFGWFFLVGIAEAATPEASRSSEGALTWQQRTLVAAGAGHKGPWRMNESDFRYVDDPSVAINEQGLAAVAWVDQSRKDVFLQIFEPDGNRRFTSPVNVSGTPEIFSWLPRVLLAPTHNSSSFDVYVLWQEIVFSGGSHGGEILFARSTDGGRTFRKPLNLSQSKAGDGKGRLTPRIWDNGSLDLVRAPSGNLYAAWTEYEGDLLFSRSTDGGESFSETPLSITDKNSAPARAPSLAISPGGSVYLAWAVGERSQADIHIARSLDAGRSFEKQIARETNGHCDAPKIASDSKGNIHLVFAEAPDGPFTPYHVRYARLTDWKIGFKDGKEISDPQSQNFQSVSYPALSLDAVDNLYVLWELFPRHQTRPRGLGFTLSANGGRSFTAPIPIPGSLDPSLGLNGSQQGMLTSKLAVDKSGAIAVVNSYFKRSEKSRVFLFRGKAETAEL